jgi:subtilisin-like proprotein convertase family protein
MNVGLDDQAALPIGPFTVVSGMINQPEQPGRLATFNGTPAGGVWTLQLADDLASNGGRLQSWSLEICGDPPPAYAIELVKTVGIPCRRSAPPPTRSPFRRASTSTTATRCTTSA